MPSIGTARSSRTIGHASVPQTTKNLQRSEEWVSGILRFRTSAGPQLIDALAVSSVDDEFEAIEPAKVLRQIAPGHDG